MKPGIYVAIFSQDAPHDSSEVSASAWDKVLREEALGHTPQAPASFGPRRPVGPMKEVALSYNMAHVSWLQLG